MDTQLVMVTAIRVDSPDLDPERPAIVNYRINRLHLNWIADSMLHILLTFISVGFHNFVFITPSSSVSGQEFHLFYNNFFVLRMSEEKWLNATEVFRMIWCNVATVTVILPISKVETDSEGLDQAQTLRLDKPSTKFEVSIVFDFLDVSHYFGKRVYANCICEMWKQGEHIDCSMHIVV